MSTGEFFLILFAVFILFGPHKIPEIAKSLAKGIMKIKNAAQDITEEVNKTIDPIKKEIITHTEKFKEDLEIKNDEERTDKKASIQGKDLIG